MPQRTYYPEGAPCWADLAVPDIAGTKAFYGGLLDWTFRDSGEDLGHYTMCLREGRPVAAISPPPPEGPPTQPAWTVYLASPDVTETGRRIERRGGQRLMGPIEIPGSGRLLMALDPTGAPFGVWQGGQMTGAELYGDPGTICWAEVNTREGATADLFYQQLFGYTQRQMGDGVNVDYSVWKVDGEAWCGRVQLGPEFPVEIPAHWLVYFAVEDADEAVARIAALGGKLHRDPFDTPYGRTLVAADPAGAHFALIQVRPAR